MNKLRSLNANLAISDKATSQHVGIRHFRHKNSILNPKKLDKKPLSRTTINVGVYRIPYTGLLYKKVESMILKRFPAFWTAYSWSNYRNEILNRLKSGLNNWFLRTTKSRVWSENTSQSFQIFILFLKCLFHS